MHDIFYLSAACSCANTVLQIFSILLVLKEHGLFRDMKLRYKRRRERTDREERMV